MVKRADLIAVHCLSVLLFILVVAPPGAFGDDVSTTDSTPEPDLPKVTTVIEGLDNPCGVAIQPGTGDVYVSESGGGRVVVVADGKVEPVITGFAVRPFSFGGTPSELTLGPLGLVFLDQHILVVGDAGLADGADLVRVFTLPARGKSIPADSMTQSLGPIAAGRFSRNGEGDFFGIAVTKGAAFITSNGDDEKGWIAKAPRSDDELEEVVPFCPTKVQSGVGTPMGIAVNKQGHLAVAQMGELDTAHDSALGFYDAVTGDLLASFRCELHDIIAVAYGPKSGRLYALDLAWGDERKGGLYRIDAILKDGQQSIKSVKLLELDRPTAMTFSADSSLYVTTLGTPNGSGEPSGKLLRIAAGL